MCSCRTTSRTCRRLWLCRRFEAPIFGRGCGTGLAGQTVNAAVVDAGLQHIRDTYADAIRTGLPDIPRRVSGYNLDQPPERMGTTCATSRSCRWFDRLRHCGGSGPAYPPTRKAYTNLAIAKNGGQRALLAKTSSVQAVCARSAAKGRQDRDTCTCHDRSMMVLISVDMEGVAGIATREQTNPRGRGYETACRLMTAEANAAVRGAYDGGATSVVVNDSHGRMDNLLCQDLDERVQFVVGSPKVLSMMEQVESDCDLALFVGYHVGPASIDGVLPHTYSGSAFSDVRLNGQSVGEVELNALIAAQFGVPVGLVTGDEQVCGIAEKAVPGVVTVAVKRGVGVTAARSMTPGAACRAIQDGARLSVERAAAMVAINVPRELLIEVELRPNGAAELARLVPGTERVSARVVRRYAADPREMHNVLLCWEALATAYVHG